MKKLLSALVVTTALVSGSAFAAETPKIGAAVYGLNAEFMQIWAAALEQHPAVVAGEVDLVIFDGRYDALVQQDQFETMITQEFDAIIFVPIDIDAGATAVEAAFEAGIPVIGSNTRVNSDKLTAYVGSDDVKSGYMEAKYVLDAIGCEGEVVIIEGPIGQSAQISRLEGNLKALEECPNVTVVEQQTANWSRAEAQTLMENWLTANPDARAQAQGALDLAISYAKDGDYEPQSDIWVTYTDMPWNGGTDAEYSVPWTPVTTENVDALLELRK